MIKKGEGARCSIKRTRAPLVAPGTAARVGPASKRGRRHEGCPLPAAELFRFDSSLLGGRSEPPVELLQPCVPIEETGGKAPPTAAGSAIRAARRVFLACPRPLRNGRSLPPPAAVAWPRL